VSARAQAHLGEGLYTWSARSEAEAYLSFWELNGRSVRTMEATFPESQYQALRSLDLRTIGNDAEEAWLKRHSSLWGEGCLTVLNTLSETLSMAPSSSSRKMSSRYSADQGADHQLGQDQRVTGCVAHLGDAGTREYMTNPFAKSQVNSARTASRNCR
jgi:hypothetical protein